MYSISRQEIILQVGNLVEQKYNQLLSNCYPLIWSC